MNARIEPIAQKFFSIDGLSSRELIPYPHDPFHRPSPWTRYDHLSMKDRLDQIDGPEEDKAIFEAFMGTIGSDMGSKIAFVEPLRWFALGGHTVSGMFEIIESYKFGPGGQTGFARSILNEYKGHLKFETVVEKIEETPMGVVASARDSESYKAKHVVCTIPL
jgi:lysyl oxidase-like protein 2/3/4